MRCRTPASALNNVDLPVFGLPTRATVSTFAAALGDMTLVQRGRNENRTESTALGRSAT